MGERHPLRHFGKTLAESLTKSLSHLRWLRYSRFLQMPALLTYTNTGRIFSFARRGTLAVLSSNVSKSFVSTTSSPTDNDGNARHNYSKEAESGVNKQISAELNASYAYLAMSSYFGRTEVALPGCEGFFLKMHEEELEHARFFINYQNLRGGKVALSQISKPKEREWDGVCQAFAASLEMEKTVKQLLLELLAIAQADGDEGMADILAGQFITEQDRSICEFGRLLTRSCKMAVDGKGEFLFDREIYEVYVKNGGKKDGYK